MEINALLRAPLPHPGLVRWGHLRSVEGTGIHNLGPGRSWWFTHVRDRLLPLLLTVAFYFGRSPLPQLPLEVLETIFGYVGHAVAFVFCLRADDGRDFFAFIVVPALDMAESVRDGLVFGHPPWHPLFPAALNRIACPRRLVFRHALLGARVSLYYPRPLHIIHLHEVI